MPHTRPLSWSRAPFRPCRCWRVPEVGSWPQARPGPSHQWWPGGEWHTVLKLLSLMFTVAETPSDLDRLAGQRPAITTEGYPTLWVAPKSHLPRQTRVSERSPFSQRGGFPTEDNERRRSTVTTEGCRGSRWLWTATEASETCAALRCPCTVRAPGWLETGHTDSPQLLSPHLLRRAGDGIDFTQ